MDATAVLAGGSPPLLDAVETSDFHDSLPLTQHTHAGLPDDAEPFRHSGWRGTRNRIAAALELARVSRSRIIRFRSCGSRCWVLRQPQNHDECVLAVEHCHDRFCVPCQKQRSSRLAANLLKLCDGKDLRFLTLTLKHNRLGLKEQLDRLTRCWKKFRLWKGWRSTQVGGVAVIELKRSRNTDCWHPHLHVITEGTFLSQSEISQQWHKVTGDSYIVDVRRVRDGREAVRYVSKYAAKGFSVDGTTNVDRLSEAILALGSKRLVQCFGSWSKFKTIDAPTQVAWKRWITLEELVLQVNAGVLESWRILRLLGDRIDITRMIANHSHTQLVDAGPSP